MKKNYQSEEEIEKELKNVGIENFVEFNAYVEYVFGKCQKCEGQLIGHMKVKCRGEGVRYGLESVRSFKHWVKRMPAFKEALFIRNQAKEDRKLAKIDEYVKITIESVESKSNPEAKTTQC